MNNLINFKEVLEHEELLVAEFFKGYGSQSMALDRLGIPNKVVVGSEVDADAIISYASARHSQEELDKEPNLSEDEMKQWLMDRNIGYDFKKEKSSIPRMKKNKLRKLYNSCILSNEVGDVSLISPSELPDFDLMTYSFPCQSISVAGLQGGFEKGSGTTSSLLWECQKVINAKKPKYLLMENVKNLVSKKFMPSFELWCKWLETLGYKNYWKVLNAKDFGIPQNRERVFMISILGEHEPYVFPAGFDSGIRLKDVLEPEVDEKYYISDDKANKLINELKSGLKGSYPSGDKYESTSHLGSREHRSCGWKENVSTLCARDYKDPKVVSIPQPILWGGEQKNQAIKTDGISTCLTSSMGTGGGYIPMVRACLTPDRVEKRQNGRRFKEDGEPMFTLTAQDKHGILQVGNIDNGKSHSRNFSQGNRVYSSEGISVTQTAQGGGVGSFTGLYKVEEDRQYRIRKLTPRECWRLMGVDDAIFDKVCESGISNSQLYKQAGNSIVVNVLDAIFSNLFTK